METSYTDKSMDHSSQELPLNDSNAPMESVAESSAPSDNHTQKSPEELENEHIMLVPQVESDARLVDSVSIEESLVVPGVVLLDLPGTISLSSPNTDPIVIESGSDRVEQVTTDEDKPLQKNDDNIDAKIVCLRKDIPRRNKKSFTPNDLYGILRKLNKSIDNKSQIRRVQSEIIHGSTIIPVDVKQFARLNNNSKIDEGHYGQVHKVKVKGLPNNLMAVKCMSRKQAENGRWSADDELTIMKKLGSENAQHVVNYYCYVTTYKVDWLYICMEWMDTSMDKFYQAMHKSVDEVICNRLDAMIRYIAYAVVSALRYLKEKEIVHRDVKPANMLINKDGIIKLCDFGISADLNQNIDYPLSEGTWRYLGPYIKACAIETDIWALAISLLEIVSGQHPLSHWTNAGKASFEIPYWKPNIPTTISVEMQKFIEDLFEIGRREGSYSYDDILKSPVICNMSLTLPSSDLYKFIREVISTISSTGTSNECNDLEFYNEIG